MLSKKENRTKDELLHEITELSSRLAEADETLRAIRSGEVDALVISGVQGEQVFTLKGAEQPYRILIEEMGEGAVTLSLDDTILYCNNSFAQMLKTPLEKMIGARIERFIQPAEQIVFRELLQKARRGNSNGEITFLTADGASVSSHLSLNALRMDGASLIYLIAMDLTEQKRMEKELRRAHNELEMRVRERTAELKEAEMKYRSIFENAVEGISQSKIDGSFITVNPALAHMLGYGSPEELLASVPNDKELYVDPVYRKEYIRLMQVHGIVAGFENRLRRKDGSIIWVESNSRTLLDSSGKLVGFEAMLTDISERKRAEEVLRRAHEELEVRIQERTAELEHANRALQAEIIERRRAEEKMRERAALLDKASDAIIVRDMENRIAYWNKGAEHLYGWTAEEAVGKNADKLLNKDEGQQKLIEAKRNVIENNEWAGELHQVTKGGKELIVESRWTLMRSNKGKPKSILIINNDTTEKKKLEAQFLRAQRMESIGTLAGGIAHDLNNVLTPIMLSLQILEEKFTDEQSRKLLDILKRNARRGADLTKQVLSFARGVEGERESIQVANILSEVEKIMKETFPRSIEVKTGINEELWSWIVTGDATQLHQVLMNLCVNARDAMPDGGILSISAQRRFIDNDYIRTNIEAKAGHYIVITVSDTGTGIPPEIMDRIFEPFFTTKEHGKGTGLGLSTTLGIVKSHGGFIEVHSKTGRGTTFNIYLPAIKAETQKAEEQKPPLYTGRGELILVVDDEAPIREVTSATLVTNGYRVLTACDGVEAITLYAQNRKEIKAVLMDMMMPVMDGQASIRALRKIDPRVKIIAVSGATEKDRFAKAMDNANVFLPKPYTSEDLLETIRNV